jgi:AraC family transcriptional regulator
MLSMVPDSWGPKLHCPAGSVTLTRTGPNALSFTAPSHLAMVFLSPMPRRSIALNADKRRLFSAPAGTLELWPAGTEVSASWETPKETLMFALSPERIRQLAILEFDHDVIELELPPEGHVDPDAFRLAKMIESEFAPARVAAQNDLYLDSLITVFSTHLLRKYSRVGQRPALRRGGLPPKAMKLVNDYIHANMAERISLADLAEVAGFSPSHFARAFQQSTGQAPYQYVIELRLQEVERLVSLGGVSLSAISQLTGFSSPSHMTATMHRLWSMTPGEIRRSATRKTASAT